MFLYILLYIYSVQINTSMVGRFIYGYSLFIVMVLVMVL